MCVWKCSTKPILSATGTKCDGNDWIYESNSRGISIFVPKDRGAISVSEIVAPEISYKVLEYNHYTMKGDIARKRETLRILADQLEPRRVELAAINKELANNVFFMFNNMNIRHNNSTEGDKNYREVVAKMTQDELENWYDETYQLCLLAFWNWTMWKEQRKCPN